MIRNEARNYYLEKKRKRDHETSLEMLSEQELEQLAALTAYDEYALDEYVFSVLGNEIKITDEEIAAALNALPEDKRNIILLFYFLDLTDREIGKLLSLMRRTVTKRRASTLEKLKKIMERK
ncbi:MULTISPECIES: RNA polymerase sigma factor [Christensenella]|nr:MULTISPECIES: sigma factor-like helix-turn-helix DNA-binding protein [Christensenella]